jgi:hypothetical protein
MCARANVLLFIATALHKNRLIHPKRRIWLMTVTKALQNGKWYLHFLKHGLTFPHFWPYLSESRDSSVDIALGYGPDDRGSRVRLPAGAGNFSLHHCVQNDSGPNQPHIQWVIGALSLGVKRLGHEADHSPPSSAEVNEWVELCLHSPSTPSWRGAQLKHRDNFTFYLYLYHI